MNCKQVIRELSDYLNGEVDPGLAQVLEQHFGHCDDCRIVVDTTRKTIQLYCNSEPLPLPADLRQRLNRALAEKIGKKSPE